MEYLVSLSLAAAALFLSVSVAGAEQERTIADSAELVRPLLVGQQIPDVNLFSMEGQPVPLRKIAAVKPTILIFYRGGWCPFCNAQLSQLKGIEPELKALGYQIVAVSPDTPDQLMKSQRNRKLEFFLASDYALEATREFGIGFHISNEYADKIRSIDGKPAAYGEQNKYSLPAPAIFILDTDGYVQFQYVNPDYRVRMKPELLTAVADALQGSVSSAGKVLD